MEKEQSLNNTNSSLKIKTAISILDNSSSFSKFKRYDPLVWFLYPDLELSAKSLSDKYLDKSIRNGVQILVCAYYYFGNIHNGRMFKLKFSKDEKENTISELFPNLDFKFKFKFSLYTSETAKWSRKCYEHFEFLEKYILYLLTEYHFRNPKRIHPMSDMYFYIVNDNIKSRFTKAHLKEVILNWKSISKKYRNRDIYLSYRNYYASKIESIDEDYKNFKRDIPEFIIEKFGLNSSIFLE
jgi:hypothetical protein